MLSVNDIYRRYESAKDSRAHYEPMWDNVLKYLLPSRLGIYDFETKGKDRSVKIYDGTPGGSAIRLSAVLNSTLSNQALNWFLLETDDAELNELDEVKDWLDKDKETVKKSLENSNFYNQITEFYLDLATIGTGTIYTEENKDPGKDLYFSTRHIRETCVIEGDQGVIDHHFCVRHMEAWQIMDRWQHKRITGKIPDSVRKAMDNNKPKETFTIIHAVIPNDDYVEDNVVDPKKFKYASVWICDQGGNERQEIDRGGYHEFPYVTEFWRKASGEDYGRGPGWDAMADVKSLYSMKKSTLRVAQQAYEPPLFMPHTTTAYPVQLRPAGVTYFDARAKHKPFPLQMGQGFSIGKDLIEDERNQIRDWFFLTQLHLIEAKDMTAEEVRARIAENAKILGPTFGRLNIFLERLFEVVLGILRRLGKLAPVPEIVKERAKERGVELKVKFVSPIVKAATISEVQGITHTSQTAIMWAKEGGIVDVLDNFDWDFGIRKVSELDGAPPEFLLDKKDVTKIREERRKLDEMRQRLEALEQTAGIAKDATEAQHKYAQNKREEMAHGMAG